MSSLTSLDDQGQITWFDSCNLSHSEMDEFKDKETTVLNKMVPHKACHLIPSVEGLRSLR